MTAKSFYALFVSSSPLRRRVLLFFLDGCLIHLSVRLIFWLRSIDFFSIESVSVFNWLFPSSLIIGLLVYTLTEQYNGLTRYLGSTSLYRLFLRNAFIVLLLFVLGHLSSLPLPPFSSWFLLCFLLTAFTGSIRLLLRDIITSINKAAYGQYKRVVIFGAGNAGVQLSASLRLIANYKIVAFVDDDPHLSGNYINGIPIHTFSWLTSCAHQVDEVLLAIPSLTREARRRIVSKIQHLGLRLLQIPSIAELTSGQASISSLRPISVEDLLGRDTAPPQRDLLGPGVTGQCVCVTGAGGSIGSELSRQILSLSPSKLVLVERSEPSLYSLQLSLQTHLPDSVDVVYILADCADFNYMRHVLDVHSVSVVFHAAAYKHVPLVEHNPLSGLRNNVFSTYSVCRACVSTSVSKFVLISSDKAVRPTNVMGASKRLAELIVQGFAGQQQYHDPSTMPTKFCMVRFGNVLGSSGSVVPLFERQLKNGGPITLTHPDIVRYFMTITEASQLVLQSSVLAEGGDLFLLDMGDPVRIKDLATLMIGLHGFSCKDEDNPSGDIDIVYTGLRPGEKLYEELLINTESSRTSHPLIFKAIEPCIPLSELVVHLDSLSDSISRQDVTSSLALLAKLIPEWVPSANL